MTLTTDFGTRDHYVAAMKAVLLRYCPDACVIDVTHEIPRHDILRGSITLERAVEGFPPGTVHLAVIDPGVGTDRGILVAEICQQIVVCPDNGLITWAWRRLGVAPSPGPPEESWGEGSGYRDSLPKEMPDQQNPHHGPLPEYREREKYGAAFDLPHAYELKWRPPSASDTFHGRDIMAPVAGMIASGTPIETIAEPMTEPVLLDVFPAKPDSSTARIIHIDAFGNATTNMDRSTLRSPEQRTFFVRGRNVGPLRRTYWDVSPGEPLALIGSSGLLEIAVRDGSAEGQLELRVGDNVTIE